MLELTTDAGEIRLEEPVDGDCDACHRRRDVTDLTVRTLEGFTGCGQICGDCLAAAIAVRLGYAHVRDGGNLEDLRR